MSVVAFNSLNSDFAQIGKDCILAEANALHLLAQNLDQNFSDCVKLISNTRGRIVVSGMGKSGHIAKKIASTLSSVGRPAIFVHPAEASHGDLGMITAADCLILLSHSGETAELKVLIDYAKRFNINLISICGNANSSLAKAATFSLAYPAVDEACPMGLAPTTSTTLMLALGDALAVCTLHCRNFTPVDFKIFHPGGNLGKQLTVVSELMQPLINSPLELVSCTMLEAVNAINKFGFGCVGLIDPAKQSLCGIITDGDIRRNLENNIMLKQPKNIMSSNPVTIQATTLAAEALNIMQEKAITSIFVCNLEQQPIGLLHIHDCLKHGIA